MTGCSVRRGRPGGASTSRWLGVRGDRANDGRCAATVNPGLRRVPRQRAGQPARSSPTCTHAAAARGAPAAASGPAQRHRAAASCSPRERVDRLLRPGRAVPRAARRWPPHGLYDDEAPGAGIITGIGACPGASASIVANDATVKGGTYYPMTVKKHLRAQEIALAEPPALHLPGRLRRRLPARCRTRSSPTATTSGGSSSTRRTMSAPAIPQIAAVMGSCTAGGAYVPAMSDETVIVREPGDDLPRRTAAGEGRDRRGGHAPRSSAAATCTPAPPASPTTSPHDDAHALADRPLDRRHAAPARRRRRGARRAASRRRRPRRAARRRPADLRTPLRRARDDRADRRRLPLA